MDDLDVYICLIEDCEHPNVLYHNRKEWLKHMLGHGQALRWECRSKTHKFKTSSKDDFIEHMKKAHEIKCSDAELNQRADKLAKWADLDWMFTSCPLCRTGEFRGKQMTRHIIGHLRRLALVSLPGYRDRAEVKVMRAPWSTEDEVFSDLDEASDGYDDEDGDSVRSLGSPGESRHTAEATHVTDDRAQSPASTQTSRTGRRQQEVNGMEQGHGEVGNVDEGLLSSLEISGRESARIEHTDIKKRKGGPTGRSRRGASTSTLGESGVEEEQATTSDNKEHPKTPEQQGRTQDAGYLAVPSPSPKPPTRRSPRIKRQCVAEQTTESASNLETANRQNEQIDEEQKEAKPEIVRPAQQSARRGRGAHKARRGRNERG